MNKRQKKKEYKKIVGRNPPKWMLYKTPIYRHITRKTLPSHVIKPTRQQDNLEGFIRAMTKRRYRITKKIFINKGAI